MNKTFEDLYRDLGGRLAEYELAMNQGIAPGILDTYEKEQLIGRMRELNSIRELIKDNYASFR